MKFEPNREFSEIIREILEEHFSEEIAAELLTSSPLIGYLLKKTKAANRGSKSRGSFANLYAIYVLVEDYLRNGFDKRDDYPKYEGARFSDLFTRQRQLPFGAKLQNHALNSRLNDEFHKFYPNENSRPIIRDVQSQRYWFSLPLLIHKDHNLAKSVIDIIDAYVDARRGNFDAFLDACRKIRDLGDDKLREKTEFISSLLSPTTDARLFEIVSFAIMKTHYGEQTVWFGWTQDTVEEQSLTLFKTGRTNANDGGIDFVMKPLGRFFQVTETLNVTKYFLDIDKLQKFPITFVIKSNLAIDEIQKRLEKGAREIYQIDTIVEKYMAAVEEIVNIPKLENFFRTAVEEGKLAELIDEIILHSQVEFQLSEDEEEMMKTILVSEETKNLLDI